MTLEKEKINSIIEGLSKDKAEAVLRPLIVYKLMNENINFINNFMKCNDVFKWDIFKNKEGFVMYITNLILKMYFDNNITFIEGARIMVLRIDEDEKSINFDLYTTL
jgi:hypothetical protein